MKLIIMRRSFYNFHWLKSSKRSSACIFLLIMLIMIILWKNDVQKSSTFSCQQVNIYGKKNQKRCYPLLINFADECCAQSQDDNCKTGLSFGIKQCVKLNMKIFNHDKNFIRRNREFSLILEVQVIGFGNPIFYGMNYMLHVKAILLFIQMLLFILLHILIFFYHL
jgi:hypothetical protein